MTFKDFSSTSLRQSYGYQGLQVMYITVKFNVKRAIISIIVGTTHVFHNLTNKVHTGKIV